MYRVCLCLLALSLAACDAGSPPPPPAKVSAKPAAKASAAAPTAPIEGPRRLPAPKRLVAIGDLHGDLDKTRAALRLAGAIDEKDAWIGGALVVVQTGDELDRGDGERAIVDLFERLEAEAQKTGGAVIALNGNHELMNVGGDFRYVTPGGFKDFGEPSAMAKADPKILAFPENTRGRAAAFLPGGEYARKLAKRGVTVVVGDTLFVHGGVLPEHARYGLGRIDREVSSWMKGTLKQLPPMLQGDDSPVWTRRYSDDPKKGDCEVLDEALKESDVRRMVVGHTVQKGGVSPACDERVWRIDVGLAAHYGGPTEVLEIVGEDVRALREKAVVEAQ